MDTTLGYDNNYESAISWQGDPYGFGDSPGMTATSPSGFTGAVTDGGQIGGPEQQAQRAGNAPDLMGNPIQGMIIVIAFLLLIGVIVHRFGHADEDFTNIRASFYNAFIIAMAAVAIIPLIKTVTAAGANANLPFMKAVNTYVQAS